MRPLWDDSAWGEFKDFVRFSLTFFLPAWLFLMILAIGISYITAKLIPNPQPTLRESDPCVYDR